MTNELAQAVDIAEHVLRDSCVDLIDTPIYIATATEHPGLLSWLGGFGGCFGATMDLALREKLEAAGEWAGRGFATIVNDDVIRTTYPAGDFLAAFVAVCTHELCHWLTSEKWWSTRRRKPSMSDATGLLQFYTATHRLDDSPTEHEASGKPKWTGHDAQFHRASCHLRERLPEPRFRIMFATMFGGTPYGLSSPYRYLRALESELVDRRGEPIRDILDSEPPAAFTTLWAADTGQGIE